MSEILLVVGGCTFYAATPSFDSLRTSSGGRWAAQERLGRVPAHQFLGPKPTTITIDGTMYPARFGGMEMFMKLQQMSRSGLRFPVISMAVGSLLGISHGLWFIDSVDDERTFFDREVPRKVTFTVNLTEYGSDAQGAFGGLF